MSIEEDVKALREALADFMVSTGVKEITIPQDMCDAFNKGQIAMKLTNNALTAYEASKGEG